MGCEFRDTEVRDGGRQELLSLREEGAGGLDSWSEGGGSWGGGLTSWSEGGGLGACTALSLGKRGSLRRALPTGGSGQ